MLFCFSRITHVAEDLSDFSLWFSLMKPITLLNSRLWIFSVSALHQLKVRACSRHFITNFCCVFLFEFTFYAAETGLKSVPLIKSCLWAFYLKNLKPIEIPEHLKLTLSLVALVKCHCTCLHLSSAPFLSPSACSARSIAFSLSSFSICIFFLIASMVLRVESSQQRKCDGYPDRGNDGGGDGRRGGQELGEGLSGSRSARGRTTSCTSSRLFSPGVDRYRDIAHI